jgi:hypothetical protein
MNEEQLNEMYVTLEDTITFMQGSLDRIKVIKGDLTEEQRLEIRAKRYKDTRDAAYRKVFGLLPTLIGNGVRHMILCGRINETVGVSSNEASILLERLEEEDLLTSFKDGAATVYILTKKAKELFSLF